MVFDKFRKYGAWAGHSHEPSSINLHRDLTTKNAVSWPISICLNSNLAPKLRGINQNNSFIHPLTSMFLLLFYSPEFQRQVIILIYRNWPVLIKNIIKIMQSSYTRSNLYFVLTTWRTTFFVISWRTDVALR